MVAAIRALSVNVCFDTVRLLVPDSIIAPESPQALLAVHGAFMSEILNCDPNKGFVAFPVALFDLELTPGAFRTLAELCRMANISGQCWPSLAQLGRKLGRSRASVSAYIAELREVGVLSTEEQKMANGYNYRLRYTVTFWKKWRSGLGQEQKISSEPAQQKPERRVQPAVRPLETKNHIHKKQHGSGSFNSLVSEWKDAVGRTPYPAFTKNPKSRLLEETEAVVQDFVSSPPPISADIERCLANFAENHQVDGDTKEVAREIAPLITSQAILDHAIAKLSDEWQPHWKNAPNTYQLSRLIKSLPPSPNKESEQKLLKSYLQRWKLHVRSLPSPAISSKVAA